MAKLLLALAFVAIVAFAEVSAYKTITTTTIVDDDVANRPGPELCQSQIQAQQLSHCQQHLTQETPYEVNLRMTVLPRPSQEEPHLQLCCQQLKNVNEECQCEAIQMVFEQALEQSYQKGGRRGSQGQKGGSQQFEQILWKAEQLPNQCNLDVQQCPIRIPQV